MGGEGFLPATEQSQSSSSVDVLSSASAFGPCQTAHPSVDGRTGGGRKYTAVLYNKVRWSGGTAVQLSLGGQASCSFEAEWAERDLTGHEKPLKDCAIICTDWWQVRLQGGEAACTGFWPRVSTTHGHSARNFDEFVGRVMGDVVVRCAQAAGTSSASEEEAVRAALASNTLSVVKVRTRGLLAPWVLVQDRARHR